MPKKTIKTLGTIEDAFKELVKEREAFLSGNDKNDKNIYNYNNFEYEETFEELNYCEYFEDE